MLLPLPAQIITAFPRGFFLGSGGRPDHGRCPKSFGRPTDSILSTDCGFGRVSKRREKNGEQQLRPFLVVSILATPGQGMSPVGACFEKTDYIGLCD